MSANVIVNFIDFYKLVLPETWRDKNVVTFDGTRNDNILSVDKSFWVII